MRQQERVHDDDPVNDRDDHQEGRGRKEAHDNEENGDNQEVFDEEEEEEEDGCRRLAGGFSVSDSVAAGVTRRSTARSPYSQAPFDSGLRKAGRIAVDISRHDEDHAFGLPFRLTWRARINQRSVA